MVVMVVIKRGDLAKNRERGRPTSMYVMFLGYWSGWKHVLDVHQMTRKQPSSMQ